MPGIRLIAMDVDGTLTNHKGEISKENAAAMRAAQEKGIVVAIATGRTPANLLIMTREAGVRCAVVGVNGTHVVDADNHVLYQQFMDPDAAAEAQRRLAKLDTEYNVVADGAMCMSRLNPTYPMAKSFYAKLEKLGQKCLFGNEAAQDYAQNGRVYKLFAYNCADIEKVRSSMRNIPGIVLSQSSDRNVEIMPVNADKAKGIRALASVYGISMRDVMTLGDEMNDLPMITQAGWGIAMGNAREYVKKAAGYVTESCDDSGVAKAIWRYAL